MDIAWSKFNRNDNSDRDTGDPLGFKSCARAVARILVPGLTQRTQNVRGFSLLALGLQRIKGMSGKETELFLQFERLIVAAYCLKKQQGETHFDGTEKAIKLLNDQVKYPLYPLDVPILTNQLSGGIWGSYRKASNYFGLLESSGGRSTAPASTELTKMGEELAKNAASYIFEPNFQLATYLNKGEIPSDKLMRAIKLNVHIPSNKEVGLFSEAIKTVDEANDFALQKLKKIWSKNKNVLTLISLEPTQLSQQQKDVLPVALALNALMKAIEVPWRKWVAGDNAATISKSVINMNEWRAIEEWENKGGTAFDVLALKDCISQRRSSSILENIQDHHRRLSESRSATPWDREGKIASRAEMGSYDFCLGAASKLFAQGVTP